MHQCHYCSSGGVVSKLITHTHTPQSLTQLLQLTPLVDNIDNATVPVNTSTNNAFNTTTNPNNSIEYIYIYIYIKSLAPALGYYLPTNSTDAEMGIYWLDTILTHTTHLIFLASFQ